MADFGGRLHDYDGLPAQGGIFLVFARLLFEEDLEARVKKAPTTSAGSKHQSKDRKRV
jgi:hypothetical protein